MEELGPIQILTVAFEGNRFRGEILPELERLKRERIVRVVDLLLVRRDAEGAVATLTATDLGWDEATDFGAMVGGLVGWGAGGEEGAAAGALAGAAELADGHVLDEQDVELLAAAVPPSTSGAILLLEHRWAIPLRRAIARADGIEIANDWLRPDDLIEVGRSFAEPDEGEEPDDVGADD
jgi:uncharacterized membrane protein